MRIPEPMNPNNKFTLTMGSDADKMLRKFIAELADKVFTSKAYSGAEYELSIFLAGYIYNAYPGEIYDAHQRDVGSEGQIMSTPQKAKNQTDDKSETKTEAGTGTATATEKVQTSNTGRRFVDLKEVIRDELRRIDEGKLGFH